MAHLELNLKFKCSRNCDLSNILVTDVSPAILKKKLILGINVSLVKHPPSLNDVKKINNSNFLGNVLCVKTCIYLRVRIVKFSCR